MILIVSCRKRPQTNGETCYDAHRKDKKMFTQIWYEKRHRDAYTKNRLRKCPDSLEMKDVAP